MSGGKSMPIGIADQKLLLHSNHGASCQNPLIAYLWTNYVTNGSHWAKFVSEACFSFLLYGSFHLTLGSMRLEHKYVFVQVLLSSDTSVLQLRISLKPLYKSLSPSGISRNSLNPQLGQSLRHSLSHYRGLTDLRVVCVWGADKGDRIDTCGIPR